ncbi:hypothetical protein NLX83_32170 [Allokutzneria sp. A3M-2-11 16]|uniref:hypothetical protein n=1 Tax=Allokutzneria sp. A3M-2-11 16 TaxID=2962043 RepID=UPI0020B73B41|nr:hypothetical protein [Allokutzneria sp. A3M-2-11 16]MCP3803935.1 hypothetical protein [Allokutzneria sp. A3M-2-11 16]
MADFLDVADDLVRRSGVVVDRRKGSPHPRFPLAGPDVFTWVYSGLLSSRTRINALKVTCFTFRRDG